MLRLRFPSGVLRSHAENLALAAIAIHVPATLELNCIGEAVADLGCGIGAQPTESSTYMLILRAARLRAHLDPNQLVDAAGHAADQVLRGEWGNEAGASAVLAQGDDAVMSRRTVPRRRCSPRS
ncbi:hypothetical protein ACFFOU_20795 [Pseudonocardia sulfidoxydans]|uniref:hypothetical protein n=1 Tax=Pseudonocardia sulfidoxydans TaxID=54011 RepID=UPI0011BFD481|nr:hypothetical protein [Pseudonocardia sulfidoxydans]